MSNPIAKRPLTAYQKQRRKELGLEDEEELSIDGQLARVEADIRRLKVEFDIFFNGGTKHPPYETKNKVETALTRLGDDRTLTYAHRYKYNSLAARFAGFRDLWRRSMQNREEGRDFITVARAKLDAMRKAADEEIAARNEAAARLMAKSSVKANAAPETPVATTPPMENPVAKVTAAETPAAKPAIPAPVHREPVRVKGPSSLLGLSEERNRPLDPAPVEPKAVETPAVASEEPQAITPPSLHLVSEPSEQVVAATPEMPVVEEPVSTELPELEAHDVVETTADVPAPVQAQPIAASAEPAANQTDEYLGVVYEEEAETDPVAEPESMAASETAHLVDITAADNEVRSEPANAAPAEEEATAEPERDVIKPLGMSFPKILPPNAHQQEPPEPVKRSRRAADRREGDRRSGDRRALPFGRRASDREAMAGRTPAEVVAEYVNAGSGRLNDIEPVERESLNPEPENVRVEHETVRVDVAPVLQVQVPPTKPAAEPVAALVVADEEVATFTFTNPRREAAKVKELYTALVNAKLKTGENSDDLLPSRFGHLLALRADKIRKSAKCDQVVFSVAIEDGRVNLNARAAN